MSYAGFVLVGGKSSRMGRDKAMLPYRGKTLVEHIAARVEAAAGSVALVGPPERYRELPFPVIPDRFPGCGPLAGIHAALSASGAEWNLIVACDMPAVSVEFLSNLIELAEGSGRDCLVPVSPSGRAEPLCAVYHRACIPAIERALAGSIRKVTDVFGDLRVAAFSVPEATWFENLNTPAEWAAHTRSMPAASQNPR